MQPNLLIEKVANIRTNRYALAICNTFYSLTLLFWKSPNPNCPIFGIFTIVQLHDLSICTKVKFVNSSFSFLFTKVQSVRHCIFMDEELARTFWNRIDELLEKQKATLRDLSAATDIKYNTLAIQRTRHSVPNSEQLYAISRYLNRPMEYLLTGIQSFASLCPEAKAVNESEELQALVRAVLRDPTLLRVISAVVESSEKTMGVGVMSI